MTGFYKWLSKELGGIFRLPAHAVLPVALFGVVVWVFWPVTGNAFIKFDDYYYVTGNAHVREGVSWKNALWAIGSLSDSNWHPLTWMSHMVDCQLFGLDPWGHHLTNVILHAFNSVLVFVVLRRLSGSTWRSFVVAALFGLHPLRVESVAPVSERKDVLSVFFWLLTMWAYLRSAECGVRSAELEGKGDGGSEKGEGGEVTSNQYSVISSQARLLRNRWFWYGLMLVFYVLGLMSKTMLVTLPFALLLLDYWPLGRMKNAERRTQGEEKDEGTQNPADRERNGMLFRNWARLIVEKVPMFLMAAGASVLSYMAQRRGGRMEALGGLSLGGRAANAAVSYVRYLGKLFWPARLCNFYPHPGHWPTGVVLGCVVLLLAISVAAFVLRGHAPLFLVGWFWYLGTLVPVIGLVQIGEQSMADRYVYMPSLGIMVICVWGFAELIRWLMIHYSGMPTRTGAGDTVRGATAGAGETVKTVSGSLAAESTPLKRGVSESGEPGLSASCERGVNESGERGVDETWAGPALRASVETGWSPMAVLLCVVAAGVVSLACAVRTRQQIPYWRDGVTLLTQILSVTHDNHVTHYCLGHLLAERGDYTGACTHYAESLRIKPGQADVHNDFGYALLRIGRPAEAIVQFQKAIALRPDFADTRNSLGSVLFEQGRVDEAIAQFREAVRLRPDLTTAKKNLEYALKVKAGRR